jgi:hypothetical protein
MVFFAKTRSARGAGETPSRAGASGHTSVVRAIVA